MSHESSITVAICNRLGLHARPAMAFVDAATAFQSEVRVRRTDQTDADCVDGKSIMHMMMLAATRGTSLVITARGEDAETACEALAKLVKEGFGED